MTTYRVRIFHTEHYRYAIGVFILTIMIMGLLSSVLSIPKLVMIIFSSVLLFSVLFYVIFDRKCPRQLVFSTSNIQLGKNSIVPEHIQKIMVFMDQHRVVFEFPIDNSEARPHFKGISIRPIENWEVFYQGLNEWAKEHHVITTIINRH